jgi:hypothetical protein
MREQRKSGCERGEIVGEGERGESVRESERGGGESVGMREERKSGSERGEIEWGKRGGRERVRGEGGKEG